MTDTYYVRHNWGTGMAWFVMARAQRGGDRVIARCYGEASARKIVKALNRD